jgi:membrane protease YdiL (CAAX protease family)
MNSQLDHPAEVDAVFFPAPKRQPHLGYAAALVSIGLLVLVVLSLVIAVAGHGLNLPSQNMAQSADGMPKASIVLEGVTFGITLLIAYLVFPLFWRRPFADVIAWNSSTARRAVGGLAVTGVAVSICAQLLESRLTLPPQMPVDKFFRHPSDVWVIAIFGTLLAPVFEEIFFRGFLLRGFAIFFDWIAVPRTEEGRIWWVSTDQLTRRSMILAGVLTSGMFAAMHAAQLGFAWNAVGLLWLVGGTLTYVRIRLNSVAASSVVHAVYNGWIFVVIFFATSGFRHLDKLSNH